MARRTWNGGTGSWTSASNWTPTGAPQAGDLLTVASGAPTLTADGVNGYGTYDQEDVQLADGTGLTDDGASLDETFLIRATAGATLTFNGSEAVNGLLGFYGASASTVTINGPTGSDVLTLQTDAEIYSAQGNAGSAIDFTGNIDFEDRGGATLTSAVLNTGRLTFIGSAAEFGSLAGTGSCTLQTGGALTVDGACAATQTLTFGDVGAELTIGNAATFAGKIGGFASGDFIDVRGVSGSSASYDATSGTLSIFNGSTTPTAVLTGIQAAGGPLTATSDGHGGTVVGYTGGASLLQSEIAMGSRAVKADVVHTMDVPNTATPITGAGIKIGIISDSFFKDGSTTDTPNTDAAAGLLPANADGTSAVTVLRDRFSGEDEGRAMAELVHQVAPGAQLYFADSGNSLADLGASVTDLQNAGCNIIVDDISYFDEPDYQTGSPLDTAIDAAVAGGVNYFTSADNDGALFYEGQYNPTGTATVGRNTVQANTFSSGSAALPVRYAGGQYMKLSWVAPWKGATGTGAPEALKFEIVDASGNVKATSSQLTDDGTKVASELLKLPSLPSANPGNTTSDDSIVVYTPNGQPVEAGDFKLTLLNGFGEIEDPASGTGSGSSSGHELLPTVNAVGAMPADGSSVFSRQPGYNEPFSAFGPGELYYDSDGKPLPSPVSAGKPNFTAPDGITTSVSSDFAPFYGTSAAAPDAAAVAALMLQANPNLTTAEVTALLAATAAPLSGTLKLQQGAGEIQADQAVIAAEGFVQPAIVIQAVSGDEVVNGNEDQKPVPVTGTTTGIGDGQAVTVALESADGNTTYGTTTASISNGAWTADIPASAISGLPNGAYLVTADVADALGIKASEARKSVTLDAQMLASPTVALAHDTGRSSTDGVTSDPTLRVTGVTGQNTLLWSTDGVNYSATQPDFAVDGTNDGSHTVYVEQQDSVGNTSTPGSVTFALDTRPPATPPVPSDAAVRNGIVDAANDTAAQAVTGTAEDGSTVTLLDGQAVVGTAVARSDDGAWSITVGALQDGPHSYTLAATDQAGNTSRYSDALAFTVDTAPPTVPAPTTDSVSISPLVSYRDGVFTLTGTASSTAGVKSVEISAAENYGARVDLGAATVNPDGTFTFEDRIGANLQGFFQAAETDNAGGTATSADPLFSLTGGLGPDYGAGRQRRYTAGGTLTAGTLFSPDGTQSVTVRGRGQTIASAYGDTFKNAKQADTSFVFDPGFSLDVVDGFRVRGDGHDTLSFKGSDFGTTEQAQLGTLLANSYSAGGSLYIDDPTSGDAVQLKSIDKAQLIHNERDITFHV